MALETELAVALAGLLGLIVGSFVNVVIYRLPMMLERQWARECAQLSGQVQPQVEPLNLMTPRSRCRKCGHSIAWHENIPVLSYLKLRGRCSVCKTRISLRYPIVELSCGVLFAYCAWRWGLTPTAVMWAGFSASCLTLALIDWDTTLLPDDITLPLLWAGLVGAALQWTGTDLPSALWGAVAGYLALWTVYWGFKLVTGKEGMGHGDFKLLAGLGAWFGWTALVPMILMASVIGALIGLLMKFRHSLREGGYVPFGPFLAGAGLTALVLGPQSVLRAIGL